MTGIEIHILNLIQLLRTPLGDRIMPAITTLGNGGFLWIVIAGGCLLYKPLRKTGILMLVALAVEVLLGNGLLKHLFARVRPCDINPSVQLLIPRPSDYSFPSGHTGAAFSAVTVLYLEKRKYWYLALILAVLIAFSRMYLYVHYFTDILGGAAVGIFSAYVAERLLRVRSLR